MHVRRFSRYCVVRVLLGGMVMECGESHVLNVYSESQNPQYVGASRFSWHILPFGGTKYLVHKQEQVQVHQGVHLGLAQLFHLTLQM